MSNPLQTFQDILNDKGLIPSEIMADGKLHRCPTQTKPYKQNGAYIAHCGRPATLWWCNWESGEQGTFTEAEERPLSPIEREALQRRQNALRRQREAECSQRREAAARQAQNALNASFPCSPEHAYLRRKGIPALGNVRQDRNGMLLLPVRDSSGKVQSLQYIARDGTKRFLVGGKIQGGHFLIPGKPEKTQERVKTSMTCIRVRGYRKSAVSWKPQNRPITVRRSCLGHRQVFFYVHT